MLCKSTLLLLFSGVVAYAAKEGVKISDIPNPNVDPTRCGRPGVQKSIICDIDNILSKEDKDVIEGRAMDISDAEFGVAIISQMISTSGTNDIEQSSKEFATALHNTWGIGDKDKQNGVLIFLSVRDRAVYLSRGSGLQEKLTDHILDLLIEHMKPYLKDGRYGDAIDAAIVEVDLIIHDKGNSIKSYSDQDSAIGGMILFVVGMGALIAFQWRQARHERGLRRGHVALSQLMRDVERSSDNRYEFSSCPICLEDFAPLPSTDVENELDRMDGATSPQGASAAAAGDNITLLSPLRPMALHCGHTFCYKCLEEYLRDRNSDKKCPICRAPVDPAAPVPPQQPSQPSNRPPSSGGGSGGGGNSPYDNPSCGASAAPGYGNSFYSRPSHIRYSHSSPELLYRVNRMRYLYPAVMTAQLHSTLQQAAQNESSESFVRAARQRTDEVTRTLTDIAKRKEAARKGSSGSRGSFGGGSSGGGRGGRW